MRTWLITLAFLGWASQACAQSCGDGNGNNGVGIGGTNINGHCLANQNDTQIFSNDQATSNTTQAITNQTFVNRFNDIQTQIVNNRLEARRGIASAFAAGPLAAGAGAAAAAGAGKAALSAGVGEFEGQWSFAAGISYALNKRFLLNAGTTVTPLAPVPLVGFTAGATLVLN